MGNRNAPEEARKYTKYAWWFMLVFALAFPFSAIVGEGVTVTMGYPSANFDTNPPPTHVAIISNLCAMLAFALPTIGVIYFGRKAVKAGDETAKAVMLIGLIVGLGIPILMMTRVFITLFG